MSILTWRLNSAGNRTSFYILNTKKFTFKVYKNGEYTCHVSKAGSDVGVPRLVFSGKTNTVQEAMLEVEKLFKEYNHIPEEPSKCKTPEILIKDDLIYIVYDVRDTAKYTTNGTDVKRNNKIYKEPFPLEDDIEIIKAKSFNKNKTDSDQVTLTIIRK